MCGSSIGIPEKYNGYIYKVYPSLEEMPEIKEEITEDMVRKAFPEHLEAECAFAFLAMAELHEAWVGATYDYFDMIAVRSLRHARSRETWKRLWRVARTFGRSNELTKADIFVLVTNGFMPIFWNSMYGFVEKGYAKAYKTEVDGEEVQVFYPTARLVNKINCSLSN